ATPLAPWVTKSAAAFAPLAVATTQAGRMPLVSRALPLANVTRSPVPSAPVTGVTTRTPPAPPRARLPAARGVVNPPPAPAVLSTVRRAAPVPAPDTPATEKSPTAVVVVAVVLVS